MKKQVIQYADGSMGFKVNNKFHRENGPALTFANGARSWYWHGKLHRNDGPAIETADGSKDFYINGKQVNELEYWILIQQTA